MTNDTKIETPTGYTLYIREGETYEDALIRELNYYIDRTDHIGAYSMHLGRNPAGVIYLIREYLKEHSENTTCTECGGRAFFGVSIQGTGTVQRVPCQGCDGTGHIARDVTQPKEHSGDWYSKEALRLWERG